MELTDQVPCRTKTVRTATAQTAQLAEYLKCSADLAAADEVANDATDDGDQHGMRDVHEEPSILSLEPQVKRISKQIAHITLVVACSVQVAISTDDPAHVSPEKVDQGRMWVGLIVAVLMVHPVNRDPPCRAIL